MSTMKKIITLVLVLTLTMILAVPAMAAAGDGAIHIDGTGTTSYDVYKIFDIEKVSNGYKYKLAFGWETFTADDYFEIENGYAIWEKNTNSVADAAAIAQIAKNFLTNSHKPVKSIKVGDTEEFAPGYYLLVPANGPCGVVLVEENATKTIEEKSVAVGHPTVDKKVQEDSTHVYGKANDVDIGQTINYQTTITAGVNAENYILHDLMDEHIAFTNAFTVLRDGNIIEPAGNYHVDPDPGDGCTFHMVFTSALCNSLAADAKLVIEYTGKLKAEAAPFVEHENKTWLTYTSSNVPSNESSVVTKTYSITVKKVDNATPANPLKDAGFVLRDNVGMYYKWNDAEGKVDWLPEADVEPTMTGADGVIVFNGVDAENFTLLEKVVPNGYTGQTDIAVSTKGTTYEYTVVNTLGQTLPETGGIGTTVFYIGGAILVVAALAALVVIKRRETSAQ